MTHDIPAGILIPNYFYVHKDATKVSWEILSTYVRKLDKILRQNREELGCDYYINNTRNSFYNTLACCYDSIKWDENSNTLYLTDREKLMRETNLLNASIRKNRDKIVSFIRDMIAKDVQINPADIQLTLEQTQRTLELVLPTVQNAQQTLKNIQPILEILAGKKKSEQEQTSLNTAEENFNNIVAILKTIHKDLHDMHPVTI